MKLIFTKSRITNQQNYSLFFLKNLNINLLKNLFLIFTLTYNFASAQNLNYTTNWLGNSGAKNFLYVQEEIHALWVDPVSGTSYGYTWFDEAGQRIRSYSSSGSINPAYSTLQPYGSELGGNNSKLFAAEANKLTVVLRSNGSNAGSVIVPGNFINGIAATESEVFVSSQNGNVYVYSTSNLSVVRNFNVGTPRRLAIDGSGFLWVITGNTTLKRYSTTGVLQSQSITLPSQNIAASVAINQSNNTIYIVDRSTDQNIKVYNNITSSPTRAADFGVVGGIFSGSRPGLVGPLRFHFNAVANGDVLGHTINTSGIGIDNNGYIYVLHGMISGAHIEKYSPTGTMQWRLIGHTFEECAYIDPTTDGTDVYAGAHHYKMNYLAPADTEMAAWYGNLAAINQSNSYNATERGVSFQGQSSGRIVIIGGKKFMWTFAQQGEVYVYRMDPDTEVLVNVGITDNENLTTWVGGSINYVDANGAMWSGEGIIAKHSCTGVTAAGVPVYNFNSPTTYAVPEPYLSRGGFVDIKYIAETDVMYLLDSLSTSRYNDWSKTSRTLVWIRDMRYNSIDPASVSVAGNYIFTDYFSFDDLTVYGRVKVWEASTGKPVFDLLGPDNYTLHEADNILNTQAYKRSNGEYIITFLDHWNNKTVVFRWCPTGSCTAINSAESEIDISTANTIFPNPAKSELTISGDLSENADYEITSIEGKALQAGLVRGGKIIVEDLSAGIYFIKIKTDKGHSIQRFVKE